ncbi:hypothetical protein SAICODRAFT_29239 [Saitoella complicata NRRL Y-17804]|uniref:uncharacterized protein n=1 Tax=Saitoella complicata (strain BCRC 22490 / CBS 7301 / JCM 7358 / NBRC 10748 / NRRL Y-17804) TaxID=698492 RepID=UPI000867222B|nr:uncharacterized protein SAICODRAFT_29239 [Saitoella complicata NRRL Y-17804]ODQ55056.1 hypothetical protein SAICODRAFT_29239 [Saitoella complicata NRRL Y-17804]
MPSIGSCAVARVNGSAALYRLLRQFTPAGSSNSNDSWMEDQEKRELACKEAGRRMRPQLPVDYLVVRERAGSAVSSLPDFLKSV